MKKILLWFGHVPSSIKKIANKVLRYTTVILAFLESDTAILITNIIPGNEDEAVRLALIEALRALDGTIKAAKTRKERKAAVGAVGAYMTAKIDGYKLGGVGVYAECFDKVYEESKAIA